MVYIGISGKCLISNSDCGVISGRPLRDHTTKQPTNDDDTTNTLFGHQNYADCPVTGACLFFFFRKYHASSYILCAEIKIGVINTMTFVRMAGWLTGGPVVRWDDGATLIVVAIRIQSNSAKRKICFACIFLLGI